MEWFERLRAEFPALASWTYVNSASLGPMPLSVSRLGQDLHDVLVSDGSRAVGDHLGLAEDARNALALLVRCQPNELAFTANVSHGTSYVAQALWDAGKRSVVALEHEFPASTIPFIKRGFEVHFVRADGHRYPLQRIDDALRGRDVLVASHVAYCTGFANDPAALGEIARRHRAHFLLGTYQSAGVLRVDFWASGASFMTGACAKWLTAGYGTGFLAVRDSLIDELPRPSAGWMSPKDYPLLFNDRCNLAERDIRMLDGGTPSLFSQLRAGEAARLWSRTGPRRVERRVRALTRSLRARLEDLLPSDVLQETDAELSGITIVPTPQPQAVAGALMDRRIATTAVRGGVRVALHAFNDDSDIERVVQGLRYARDRLGLPLGPKSKPPSAHSKGASFMDEQPPSPPGASTVSRHLVAPLATFAMFGGMKLELFTHLAEGPRTAAQLAGTLGVAVDRLERLLYNLVTAGLLTVEAGEFCNTPEADAFLVRGKPDYLGGLHELYVDLFIAALRSAESVRAGAPLGKVDFEQVSDEALGLFIRGSHPGAVGSGRDLHRRFDFSSARRLVDVGGGSGGLALAITEACPGLQATVVDFPRVIAIAEQIIAEERAGQRVSVASADVVKSPIPATPARYDVAVLRALLQVLPEDDCARVLGNVFRALEPGGTVYIMGWISDDSRVSPTISVAYDMLFMNIYDHGRVYTHSEYNGWLSRAGFVDSKRYTLGNGFGILRARKPAD